MMSPDEIFVQNYLNVVDKPEEDAFRKVLGMKNVKKSEEKSLLEDFRAMLAKSDGTGEKGSNKHENKGRRMRRLMKGGARS